MNISELKNVDIIIVGSGIVGLCLANALANTKLTIAIVDQIHSITKPDLTQYDLRVSAINSATQSILHCFGIWNEIVKIRVSPYQSMYVWDALTNGSIQFNCTDIGRENLGYIIENNVLHYSLYQRLKDFHNVFFLLDNKPQKLKNENKKIQLYLENDILQADLLVGADGAHSWVREQIQVPVHSRSYHQDAIVTTIKTSLPHHATAWQRFLPTGPLAFLPMNDPHICSIVWSHTHAQELMQLTDQEFNKQLAEAFMYKLGQVSILDKRLIFPLHMRHAQQYVIPNIALMGDAVHTIHPLAGQGINLGILDAACLAEVLQKAMKKRQAIGSYTVLRSYERWRKGENTLMIAAMEGFNRLFTTESVLLKTVRNVGLNTVNHISPIKNLFIQRAMGLSGDLPDIAKQLPF